MQVVWEAEGLFKKICNVQDMFQDLGAERTDPRHYKIKLVEEQQI